MGALSMLPAALHVARLPETQAAAPPVQMSRTHVPCWQLRVSGQSASLTQLAQ
jgi:hypothetical protein